MGVTKMEELNGLTAWITGAASGIGRSSAFRLAAAGAVVAGLDLNAAALDAAWQGLPGTAFVADVRDLHSMEEAHRALHDLVGPPDLLINAAGIAGSERMDSHDPCVWGDVLDTNLTGSFNTIRLVFGGMCERGFGRIVNLASGTAVRPRVGTAAYGASKAGVIALTKVTALEGAPHGVTANAVAPGLVDTPMMRAILPTDDDMAAAAQMENPVGRALHAEEVAHVIWFLCLPDSGAINGQTIHVNQGSLMP
jgi:NAD(P)-dependent dehydrogenase (short-subunit alcohol dehydrogenase family)